MADKMTDKMNNKKQPKRFVGRNKRSPRAAVTPQRYAMQTVDRPGYRPAYDNDGVAGVLVAQYHLSRGEANQIVRRAVRKVYRYTCPQCGGASRTDGGLCGDCLPF